VQALDHHHHHHHLVKNTGQAQILSLWLWMTTEELRGVVTTNYLVRVVFTENYILRIEVISMSKLRGLKM